MIEKKNMVIISTDDLSPATIKGQFEYFDELKRKHPDLRIIAFTVARWNNEEQNDISQNQEFIDFCNDRNSWLRIAYHGLSHENPRAEAILSLKQQLEFLGEMQRIFTEFKRKCGCDFLNYYKPPRYRWNSDTLFACSKMGIEYLFIQDGVLNLKNNNFKSRAELGLIDSHVNPITQMPDRIDKFHLKIEELILNDDTKLRF